MLLHKSQICNPSCETRPYVLFYDDPVRGLPVSDYILGCVKGNLNPLLPLLEEGIESQKNAKRPFWGCTQVTAFAAFRPIGGCVCMGKELETSTVHDQSHGTHPS